MLVDVPPSQATPPLDPEVDPNPELEPRPELAPPPELAACPPELDPAPDPDPESDPRPEDDPPLDTPASPPHVQGPSALPSALHTWNPVHPPGPTQPTEDPGVQCEVSVAEPPQLAAWTMLVASASAMSPLVSSRAVIRPMSAFRR
jgi:hypothetical protein